MPGFAKFEHLFRPEPTGRPRALLASLALAVLALGCGASGSRPALPEGERGATPAPVRDVSPASDSRPETLPESRTDAAALTPTPELAAGDALYAAAMGTSIDPPSTAADPLGDLYGRAAGVIATIGRALDAYQRDAATPALLAVAYVRMGDLSDSLASRLVNVATPFPLGSNEARAFEEGFDRIERESGLVRPLFCGAVRSYGAALALDPLNERARSQIDAYGAAFVAGCIDHPEPH